jgi:hypothetical protein
MNDVVPRATRFGGVAALEAEKIECGHINMI